VSHRDDRLLGRKELSRSKGMPNYPLIPASGRVCLPGSPDKSRDYCEREHGGDYARGLLPDSTPSLRRDQEQEPAYDGSRQSCGYEQSKPADYHLQLAVPTPTLDRPERQFGRNEERCRHDRCTGVERAGSQAQKERVSRTDPDETPGQKRGPTGRQGKRRNEPPDSAERSHDRNQPVTGERRVGAHSAEKRDRCQPGT
jgi:hypothetical protein